jgi:hypothetical protein
MSPDGSLMRQPDWTEAIGPGLCGLGYHLLGTQGLVLLSRQTSLPAPDGERLWPFLLTKDGRRNVAMEHSVAGHERFAPLIEHQPLGNDDLLCVREKNFGELLKLLKSKTTQDAFAG